MHDRTHYFGFPREWGDVTFFKQPAYMALHTGSFTLPTALGHRPYADLVYAAYPPLYTYLSWLVFNIAGFTVYSSLAFDLAVHLILTGLLGWLVWRKTGHQVVAALFILLSTAFLLPEGRPDELAALFALLAIMASVRRHYLGAALLLGLSLATQPTQAILGAIMCVCIDLVASRFSIRCVARWLGLGAVMLAVCGLIWLPSVAAHLPEAAAQFRAHSAERWELGIVALLRRERLWAPLWVCLLLFIGGSGVFLLVRPPAPLRHNTEDWNLLRGLLLALPVCLAFLLIIGSPYYGYRLLNVLYLAAALWMAHLLTLSDGRWRLAVEVFAVSGLLLLTALLNYNTIRFILAPFTYDEKTVTYAEALAAVRATVPPDATVGGDSVAWWTITDGRPYAAFPWYQAEPWPDYILSTTLWGEGGKPNVLQKREQARRIAAEYEEITPFAFPVEACALRILGRSAPLARSGTGCDWYVWIWKRK